MLPLLIPIENFRFFSPSIGRGVQSPLCAISFFPTYTSLYHWGSCCLSLGNKSWQACPSFGHLHGTGGVRSAHGHHLSRAVAQQFSLSNNSGGSKNPWGEPPVHISTPGFVAWHLSVTGSSFYLLVLPQFILLLCCPSAFSFPQLSYQTVLLCPPVPSLRRNEILPCPWSVCYIFPTLLFSS